MVELGFHASHEQIAPSQLLRDLRYAEQAGFQAAMCSDHFMPFSARQGHSGFAFSWVGAALATTQLRIGSVVAPGQRYHPAIAAQAMATLSEMFPGRYWAALGSGQNLNEHVTGERWPDAEQRRVRLEECVAIIRALHRGETVSHRGLVTVDEAFLYDRPAEPTPLFGACISPESARRAARWAEGLITLNQPEDAHVETLKAYREAGGVGPAMLQVHLSWAETQQKAEEIALEQWSANVVDELVAQDLPTPAHFDAVAKFVPAQAVNNAEWTSPAAAFHVERILQAAHAGFDTLYLHHVGQDQRGWLDFAGKHIIPAVMS